VAEDQSKMRRPRYERVPVTDTFMNNLSNDEVLLLTRLVAKLDCPGPHRFSTDEYNLILKFRDFVDKEELDETP
jgi:hypothetical protein